MRRKMVKNLFSFCFLYSLFYTVLTARNDTEYYLQQLEYNRYLNEVIQLLRTDPKYAEEMKKKRAPEDNVPSKLAENLNLVSADIRTKLDEIKRREVQRLAILSRRKFDLNDKRRHLDIQPKFQAHHIDISERDFSVKDLEKLMTQTRKELDLMDKQRKEEFKKHEMKKELIRREKLKKLDDMNRKNAEEEFKRVNEARKKHPKVNEPGSEDQLEEVWEKQDGLEGVEFNPKTFFKLHDLNDDDMWDEFEVAALFQSEIHKIYNSKEQPDYDPVERDEEMNRMREHYMNEFDLDKDRIITLKEFLRETEINAKNHKNEEWKSVEDQPQFNEQEFQNYSKQKEFEATSSTIEVSNSTV